MPTDRSRLRPGEVERLNQPFTTEELDELEALAKAACLLDGDPHWWSYAGREENLEGLDDPDEVLKSIWVDLTGNMPILSIEEGLAKTDPWRSYQLDLLRFVGKTDPMLVLRMVAQLRALQFALDMERNSLKERMLTDPEATALLAAAGYGPVETTKQELREAKQEIVRLETEAVKQHALMSSDITQRCLGAEADRESLLRAFRLYMTFGDRERALAALPEHLWRML